MSLHYKKTFQITPDHLDNNQHVNNVIYVEWMQTLALMHASQMGWDKEKYLEQRVTWVAKQHIVNYHKQVFLDDQIIGTTWIDSAKSSSCIRKYEFIDNTAHLVCSGQTQFVLINTETQRPTRIPKIWKAAFGF